MNRQKQIKMGRERVELNKMREVSYAKLDEMTAREDWWCISDELDYYDELNNLEEISAQLIEVSLQPK